YVYSDQDSYDPLARIDGVDAPEIFWFHCQPNGTPERMTDSEGPVGLEWGNNPLGKNDGEIQKQVKRNFNYKKYPCPENLIAILFSLIMFKKRAGGGGGGG
ncbi:hypothetical protein ACVGWT_01575, partial [Enterobacter hormaechei]